MTADASLKIAGLYQNLVKITDFVTKWARTARLNDRAMYAVQMSVDEACSNIIEHAYGGEGKGDIHLRCELLDAGLRVTIVDFGRPFNPQLVEAPNLRAPLEEWGAGGLGLFLMRQLMDEVSFSFKPGRNELVMLKKRTPPA